MQGLQSPIRATMGESTQITLDPEKFAQLLNCDLFSKPPSGNQIYKGREFFNNFSKFYEIAVHFNESYAEHMIKNLFRNMFPDFTWEAKSPKAEFLRYLDYSNSC